MTPPPEIRRQIGRVFDRAQVDGWLHVVGIEGDAEVDVGADTPVALASVFKLPVLVALHRAAESGTLDLQERIRVPAATRTPGVTGLAALCDDAELSLRDLAQLMITLSDNAAADAVVDRVGLDAVARTLDELGLHHTRVEHACRDMRAALADDLARTGTSLARALGDPTALASLRVLDPAITNHSTPREMTALLAPSGGTKPQAATPARPCAGSSPSRSGPTGWPAASPPTTWLWRARPARSPRSAARSAWSSSPAPAAMPPPSSPAHGAAA